MCCFLLSTINLNQPHTGFPLQPQFQLWFIKTKTKTCSWWGCPRSSLSNHKRTEGEEPSGKQNGQGPNNQSLEENISTWERAFFRPLPSLSLSIIIEEQLSFLTGWREQKEVAKTKNAGTSKGTKSGIHSSSCFSPLFKLLTPIHKAEEELDGGPLQMDDAKFILDLGENAQSAPVIQ